MGLFYGNLTVYQPKRTLLLDELRRMKRKAFLSPTISGYTIIFDDEVDDQDFDCIERLGKTVTEKLSCSALAAVLHDDDVLYLWLFQNGHLTDNYNSLPQYFDPDAEPGPPEGGDAEMLCQAFDRRQRTEKVELLLRANLLENELPNVRAEQERHEALAAELGMPVFVAALGYEAIAGGDVPEEFKTLEFERV